MKIDELPTIKNLHKNVAGFKVLFKIYSFFRFFGLRNKKLDEVKTKFDALYKQLDEHKQYATKFNKYFSSDGWVVYDSLNYDFIKKSIEAYENEGKEETKKLLLDYFSPKNIEKELIFLKFCKELRDRYRFIEYALEDYKKGKYYAAIPILLMVIDGVVSDVVQRGFHARKIDLNVWDAVTAVDNGINAVKKIFQQARKKTTKEPISFPYRHGILHGRDLAYDNHEVVAKTWCFLFVVSDWVRSKSTEQSRKEKFIKEMKAPPLSESLNKLLEIQRMKEKMAEWRPRKIGHHYIEAINQGTAIKANLPEYTAFEYCKLWCRKNYGYMSNLYAKLWKQEPAEIRDLYDIWKINKFEILDIKDDAPAITEVFVNIYLDDCNHKKCKLRLIYEDDKGNPLPRNMEGGTWKMVLKDNY